MFFTPLTKSKLTFEGERPYENVVMLLYRHWLTLVLRIISFGLFAILPIITSVIGGPYINQLGLGSIYQFVIVIYYLIWWNGLFYTTTMYLLDTWVVTDHRILDNEQHGFFSRTLSEMSLSKIQDQTVSVKGLIPTFFDYGDLEIQTAGTEPKFSLKQIPHPAQVKADITQLYSDYISQHKDGVEVHDHTSI